MPSILDVHARERDTRRESCAPKPRGVVGTRVQGAGVRAVVALGSVCSLGFSGAAWADWARRGGSVGQLAAGPAERRRKGVLGQAGHARVWAGGKKLGQARLLRELG